MHTMSFGLSDESSASDVMSEINMTPLVDVMLVLLVIFMITLPVLKHAVRVELPAAASAREQTTPRVVQLSVDAQGQYFWNDAPITDAALPLALQAEAAQSVPPELRIRGDRQVRYERVAQAMAAAQQSGLKTIGFVTEPKP
jgi:biopolymer transport protein ExbD